MNIRTNHGKRSTTSAFRFVFSGRQVIYLLAGAVIASNCSLALAKEPPNWDKLLAKGNEQLTQGNTKEATDIFAKLLVKYPDAAPPHLAYGKALKRAGKISEAKTEFRAATVADPSLAESFHELGIVCESDKEYQNAIDAFEKYLELKPDAAQRQNVPDRIRFCKEKLN